MSIAGGANALVVGTGGSNTTIDAGAGGASVYIGTGSIAGSNLINGGSGPLLIAFAGGTGSATIFGGTGQTSLFGAAGADVQYDGTAGGGLLCADGTDASAETLNAAGSTSNDTLFAAQGNVSLVAGSGDDVLIAGDNTGSLGGGGSVVGGATLAGGSGHDLFLFASTLSDGADVITNFTASDDVFLGGYDALAGGMAGSDTQAMHALQNVTQMGGNATIALADGTTITFVDITTAQLQGHLFSS
jgi:Ca2+-binding RTX toxin-like protein